MLRNKRSLAARQREMRKRQPAHPGPGRPPLPIRGEMVELLAKRLYSLQQIAVMLCCCPNTLRNRFQEDFERGQAKLNAELLGRMFERALKDGNQRALKWQMRQRGLFGLKPPRRVRRPRPLVSGSSVRGRTYQPIRNRYPANRKPRCGSIIVPPPPTTPAPVPRLEEPKPRRPWRIVEFAM